MIGIVVALIFFILTSINFVTYGATVLEWLFAIFLYSIVAFVINVGIAVGVVAFAWIVGAVKRGLGRGQ
jgi:hypothetical protein